jgi:hypothetical protein
MVWEDLTPARMLTRASFDNAHHRGHGHGLLDQRHHPPGGDVAPRRPLPVTLDDFDAASRRCR